MLHACVSDPSNARLLITRLGLYRVTKPDNHSTPQVPTFNRLKPTLYP